MGKATGAWTLDWVKLRRPQHGSHTLTHPVGCHTTPAPCKTSTSLGFDGSENIEIATKGGWL